ncbi:putative quinol monooxygenase [Pseudonocardia sp. RS010]|uniref:putative quinol monooxygenase n=1 Tax=Pseudonocardia sp. RS010 TaxID=3385979 RepID=UPI00399F3900
MSVIVISHFSTQPGERDNVLIDVSAMVEMTRTMPGFLALDVAADQDDPNAVIAVERWETRRHHEEYLALRAGDGSMADFAKRLSGAPTFTYADVRSP